MHRTLCDLGSHKQGLRKHGKSIKRGNVLQDNQAIELSMEEEQRVIQTTVKAGQATFHHGLLVHSSPPNRSFNPGRRRCAFSATYITPQTVFEPMHYTNQYQEDWRRPILVNGKDDCGKLKYTTTLEDVYANTTKL